MSDGFDEQLKTRVSRYRDRIVNGPILRMLVWLGIPPLINQLIVVAYNVSDAYWLGFYSDVSVTVPRQMRLITMLFEALLNALNAASLSIVSQYVGRGSYREASRSASRFFTISFTSGAVFMLALLGLRRAIFTQVVSTPPEVFEDMMSYSAVISFDIFLNYISLTFTTLLQSMGDTRRPAVVNATAVALNALLDPFMILGLGPFPRLGVVGASITDVMGKAVSVGMLTYMIRRSYPELRVTFTRDLDLNWISLVMRVGLPVLTLESLDGFAFLMQLRIVNTLGVVAATAYALGFIIVDVVDSTLRGLSSAVAVMIGQNLGAGNYERAREIAYKSALLIFTTLALGATCVYPVRSTLVRAFVEEPSIIAETSLFLETLLPTLPFFGLFAVARSVGRGSGYTLPPTSIGMFRLWGMRVALGYILAFTLGMGSLGAWLAIGLGNIVSGVASTLWMKYGKWAKEVVEKNTSR